MRRILTCDALIYALNIHFSMIFMGYMTRQRITSFRAGVPPTVTT